MDDIGTLMVTMNFECGFLTTVDSSRIAEYGYDQRVEVQNRGETKSCFIWEFRFFNISGTKTS